MSMIEKNETTEYEDSKSLRKDKRGLPLIPQPSADPSDPLNFPRWLKIAILIQVSIMALLGPLNQATMNPAFAPLGVHFHKTTVEARWRHFRSVVLLQLTRAFVVLVSYQTEIAIGLVGVGAFIWVPLANNYGRRPVLLLSTLIAAASSLGSAQSRTWSQVLATRALNGLATSTFFTMGAGVVADTYFLHERGRAMGVFTVCLTNSGHVAPIPGGFFAQYVNFEWCYYLPAILDITMFIVMLFCLPETLYFPGTAVVESKHPILRRMKLWGFGSGRHVKISDFVDQFQMFKYPSVLFSALYYSLTFVLSSIMSALTSAALFGRLYGFSTSQIGLALGFGTLIGSTLGELLGGIVVDRMMYLSRKKLGDQEIVPEARLHGIWAGAILQPIGLLIWGFCIQSKTPWIGPTIGFAIMCFAIQIISTVLYSYCSDCYKPQTIQSAQVFNFGRQSFGTTASFWVIPLGDKIGFQFLAVTMMLIGFVIFAPVVLLIFKGKAIRERMGSPRNVNVR